MTNTILWYDLETFGLNTRYDRIAQAAWLRTDMDLNPIGEGKYMYCRLSPDYLPTPSSCLVTGITPQTVNRKGFNEAQFSSILRSEFMERGTIAAGYNNASFDDEMIRSLLYRNLYDPYEREWGDGRSRWDLLPLVRAVRDLRPSGIVFDKINENTGAPSFKLTDLTEENGIEQKGAHDALVDVIATVQVARLIKQKQGEIFKWSLDHRGRKEISASIDVMKHTPFLSTQTAFVSERGNTHPLLPLFYDPENPRILYCFDLLRELPKTAEGSYRDTGIFQLYVNRLPFVAPLSVLTPDCEERLKFTREEIMKRAGEVIGAEVLSKKSILASRETYEQKPTDPDLALYDGSFLTEYDKNTAEKIRRLPPSERLSSGEHRFKDDKYHTLLWRHTARNWPEVLNKKQSKEWKNFCALRLLSPVTEGAMSHEYYMRNVNELLHSPDTNASDKRILLSLKAYGEELYDKILKS